MQNSSLCRCLVLGTWGGMSMFNHPFLICHQQKKAWARSNRAISQPPIDSCWGPWCRNNKTHNCVQQITQVEYFDRFLFQWALFYGLFPARYSFPSLEFLFKCATQAYRDVCRSKRPKFELEYILGLFLTYILYADINTVLNYPSRQHLLNWEKAD